VNLRQRGKGRPPDLGRIQLPRLYTTARTINNAKTADLLSLFDFIPPLYHGFYNTLLASTDVEDNRDSEQSDSEPSNSEPSDNEDSEQEENEGEESVNEQELEPDECNESD